VRLTALLIANMKKLVVAVLVIASAGLAFSGFLAYR